LKYSVIFASQLPEAFIKFLIRYAPQVTFHDSSPAKQKQNPLSNDVRDHSRRRVVRRVKASLRSSWKSPQRGSEFPKFVEFERKKNEEGKQI
jgi:hypothetical protein